ncbi:hypothetical protein EASAB2608_04017 [Streptomyces sp. EAS-AB2608]|nr:hypothetical protein EASAB2608_04017 [Streptomyces sp. EAS-AB2608]
MSLRAGRHTPPAGAQGPAAPYRSVGRAGCPLVRGHEDTARAHGSPLGSVRRAHSYGDVSVASVPAQASGRTCLRREVLSQFHTPSTLPGQVHWVDAGAMREAGTRRTTRAGS